MIPLYCMIAGLVTIGVATFLARADPCKAREEDLVDRALIGMTYLAGATLIGFLWPGVVLFGVVAGAGALLIRVCRP